MSIDDSIDGVTPSAAPEMRYSWVRSPSGSRFDRCSGADISRL